ncbi:4-hydroxybenzoate octaprenyltransferase [Acuticoccus sp. M5D2P5]|uniref:4-hydroxybenzoate octaprenyltransferase n=1 Tax=Acuticoccus kalidii TaxID=2910977 RepID=UPI001F34F1C3|nr:4-hydroxybenzoate octaprenyltransferase [Acuticoccus kalidii]MCF3933466.1 4-hydroxybenzoate octaprenyltransferase [Acuticoccus kalidii]
MSDVRAVNASTGRVQDAPSGNFVDRFVPGRLRPYAQLARLDRPIGWWLLMWPCWWSVALAGVAVGAAPNLAHLALFMIGAIVMRGAGCTYNDILDRNIDAHVERTKSRPIPSGRVSAEAAMLFMLLLAFIGLAVLLSFNAFTIMMAFGSLVIVAFYPLAKRVTDWPQFILGLAFSWGAWLGWSATLGTVGWAPAFLYVGSICWTIGYDTIYAHQDRRDDAIIGVRSTARHFGANTKRAVGLFYGATVLLFAGALWFAGAGLFGYLGLAAFAIHLGQQVTRVSTDDPASCLDAFRSNRWAGWLLFVGLVADSML